MKKKLIITESQYKRLINEQVHSPDYLDKVSRRIEPPYFYNMEEQFGVTDHNDQLEVLKYIYGEDITIDTEYFTHRDYEYKINNSNGNQIYSEESDGSWSKKEYDSKGKKIYEENSYGYWFKFEYDELGNVTHYESKDGWFREEFDENGNQIYFENSVGKIIDNRNITESQYKRLINEEEVNIYLDKIKKILEPPYFYNLREHFGIISDEEIYYVMKYIFNNIDLNIDIDKHKKGGTIENKRYQTLYHEYLDGKSWKKTEYCGGYILYVETHNGFLIDNRDIYDC